MITSKLSGIGTSIFAVMSKLAAEHNAVNLSQGFPDFQCSEELMRLVYQHMSNGHNQYAPMPGVMVLRERIAEKIEELHGAKYNPETEITVTAGATQAIYTAITALVRENDEVIIFEPAYDSYIPAIKLSGATPIFIEMRPPNYGIDWEEVKKNITSRTRLIILNTPNNPSGSILSETDMVTLSKIVSGTKIFIISDEVYEHIIFDGNVHQSMARFPKLAERTIIISSFGKTYHTTGWKVGYCVAPAELMNEFRKIHQFNVFSVNTPVQYAYADFMQKKEEYLGLNQFYQERRDYFTFLMKISRFKCVPSKGTYFQLFDYSNITDENDKDFAVRLTKQHGIAPVPLSSFYHDNPKHKVLRFCFAKTNEVLEKAAKLLVKV